MKKKFNGALKERIAPPKSLGIIRSAMGPDAVVAHYVTEMQRIDREWQDKLLLLAEHYGIPANGDRYAGLALALALARDFVPGFQFMKQRGAPEKWPDMLSAALVVEMDAIIQPRTKGRGPTYAANYLSKRAPWSAMIKDLTDPVSALLNEYKKATKHEADLVAIMRKTKEHYGALWFEQIVAGLVDEAIN